MYFRGIAIEVCGGVVIVPEGKGRPSWHRPRLAQWARGVSSSL
jgi:hypothetical protein